MSWCFTRFAAAWFACALVGGFSPAVRAQTSRTAKDGVYSDEQARRGQAVYNDRCTACHGATLGGDLAPPLAGNDFMAVWGGPLSDIVNKIQNTMPATEPGTLTRQQSSDIVAYMLQVGQFPAGRAELSADEAVQKQIALATAQPAQARPQAVATS